MAGTSVGTAYLDVEPRLDGFRRELDRKLTPIARRAGRDLGQAVGRDASQGLDRMARAANHAEREIAPLGRRLRGLGDGVGRESQNDLQRLGRAADSADRQVSPLARSLRSVGRQGIGRGAAQDLDRTTRAARDTDRGFRRLGIGTRLSAGSIAFLGRGAAVAGGFIGAAGLGGAIGFMARETADAQVENAKLTGVLRSMGKEAPASRREIERLTTAISRQTGEDDELVKSSLTTLATFKQLGTEQSRQIGVYGRAGKALKGLSLIFGVDMNRAAIQLGKALNDPSKGLNALSRQGITFTKQQKEMVDKWVEQGKIAKAQNFILKEVEQQTGKVSREYGRSLPAALGRAKVGLGDLAERYGNRLAPSVDRGLKAVTGFVKGIETGQGAGGRFADRVTELGKGFTSVARPIAGAVRGLAKFTGQHPGLAKLAGAAVAVGVAFKALRGVGSLTGLTQVGGMAKGGLAKTVASKAAPIPVFVVNQMPGAPGVGGKGGKVPPIVPAAGPSALMRAVPWLAGAAALFQVGRGGLSAMRDPNLTGRAKGPREALGKTVDIFAKVPGPVQGVGKLGQALGLGQGETDKVKKRLTGIKFEVQQLGKTLGKPIRLRLDADPKKAVKDLRSIRANFDFLRKSTFISMKDMLRTTGDNFLRIKRTMDLNSKGGQKAVTDNFRLGARHIKTALQSGEISTSQGMQAIRRLLRQHSGGGKEAVKTNMFEVRKILAQTMDKGVSITDKGAGRIRRIFARELKAYGIKGREAEIYMDVKPGKGKPKNYQRGGLLQLGREGERGRDSIPMRAAGQDIVAAPGEKIAVLTHHQQADLNARTADVGGLPGFFKRNRRKHYMARGGFVPGYAPGGIVPVPGEPGTTIHRSILEDVIKLDRRYKLDINDGYAPTGHAAGGDHPKGMGFDAGPDFGAGGSWGLVSQLAKWAEPQQNNVRSPFRWIGYTGDSGHGPGDHIHVGFKGPGIKGLGGAVGKIARQMVGGPDSPLKSMVQKVLDRSRGAAQKKLDSVTSDSTGTDGVGAGPVGAGRASRSQMVRWARTALERTQAETGIAPTGANIEKILILAQKESGWDPKSINMWDSNAKAGNPSGGLMHITMDKVGGSKAKLFDPLINMMTSIKYQAGKFHGQLTTKSPYARGGILNAAKGLYGLGTMPSAAEIKKQESTVKKLTDKKPPKKEADQKRLARDLTKAKQTLKSMKGKRGKGLEGRTKGTKRLNAQVEAYKLPEGIAKGVLNTERHLEDLGSYYDQNEADYRVDEVLSQGELDALVAQKTHIRNLVGGDPLGSSGQLAAFRDWILPMVHQKLEGITGFIERLKARVSRNMKALNKRLREAERLRKLIKEKNSRIKTIQAKKKKSPADRRQLASLTSQRDGLMERLGIITQREIPALEADNMTVIGEKRPKSVAGGKAGENALLPDAREVLGATDESGGPSLRGYAAEYAEKLRPGALQAEWKGHNIAIQALLREGATKPETTEDASKSQLTELLKEQLQQSQLRTAVSEAHFKVLRQTPFGGVFHEGGVVPGPYGQERMILARAGETVTPADGGSEIKVILEDHRTTITKDDRVVRQIVHEETRSMARSGSRGLPGRPGVLA